VWLTGLNPEPAAQPLDLETEVVPALRLSSDEMTAQAAFLTAAIAGARTACETFTGRLLIKRTVELWAERWDDEGAVYRCGRLRLLYAPTTLVNSVKYLDSDGTLKTWDSSTGWDKMLPTGDVAGRAEVFPRVGQCFPASLCQPASIKVNYDTGYGTSYAAIPARLKQGMLLFVGEAYARRELVTPGTILPANPISAERCWKPFKESAQ